MTEISICSELLNVCMNALTHAARGSGISGPETRQGRRGAGAGGEGQHLVQDERCNLHMHTAGSGSHQRCTPDMQNNATGVAYQPRKPVKNATGVAYRPRKPVCSTMVRK